MRGMTSRPWRAHSLDEAAQVAVAVEADAALDLLVVDPDDVTGDGGHTARLHLQQLLLPLPGRVAGVVELAGDREPGTAATGEPTAGHLDRGRRPPARRRRAGGRSAGARRGRAGAGGAGGSSALHRSEVGRVGEVGLRAPVAACSSRRTSSLAPGRRTGRGDVEGALRAAVPVAAEMEAVDPGLALGPAGEVRGRCRPGCRPRRCRWWKAGPAAVAARRARRGRRAEVGAAGSGVAGPSRAAAAPSRRPGRAGPCGRADARPVVDAAHGSPRGRRATAPARGHARRAGSRSWRSRSRTPTGCAVDEDLGAVAAPRRRSAADRRPRRAAWSR